MRSIRTSASYYAAALGIIVCAACGSAGGVDESGTPTGSGGVGMATSAGGGKATGGSAGGSSAGTLSSGGAVSAGGTGTGGTTHGGTSSSGSANTGGNGLAGTSGGSPGLAGSAGTSDLAGNGGTSNEAGSAGASGSGFNFGGTSSAGGTSDAGGTSSTGAGGNTSTGGQGGSSPIPECSVESQYVYVLTDLNKLYKFDPPNLTFTLVGTLKCKTFETPYSMAVARSGQAYSVFTDGSLYTFDVATANCQSTPFKAGQNGFNTFGMGFSSQGSVGETLFVANSDMTGLASIDLTSWKLTPIGNYDKLMARAELTGTSAGQLWGAFEGSPYVVAEIDESNASILSQAPQTSINYPPSMSNFAFAFWGGDFWLFVGPGGSTDVFQYDPMAGTTNKVKSVDFEIVGAGVSTCAPLVKP